MDSAIKTAHCRLFAAPLKDVKVLFGKPNANSELSTKEKLSPKIVSTVAETVDTTECPLVYSEKEVFVKLVSVYFLIDYRLRANNITPVFLIPATNKCFKHTY
jgi:hypothetical protein